VESTCARTTRGRANGVARGRVIGRACARVSDASSRTSRECVRGNVSHAFVAMRTTVMSTRARAIGWFG
jgi:hypothetical protein